MSYAIVGILVIAFIAFVVLSAKAWHWSNIVFLILTFLTGLGGLIAMSQVLDGRRAQMQEMQKSEKDLRSVEQQIEQVLYGTEGFEYSKDSLRGLSEALNLELAGRGRVWKSGEISSKGENRVFQFPSERLGHTEQVENMENMILFAYSDRVFENDDNVYPVSFVGSFRVIEDTPSTLELAPVYISDREEYQEPLNSWTLFEKSPVDQRDAYIRDTGIVLNEDDSKLNERLAEYRTLLVQQYLPAELFGMDLGDKQQARDYEAIIDRIMFDGLPLVKIESFIESQSDRVAERFDPPPEEIFVRYRFDSKSNRPYQVDSTGNIENDGQFTKTGMAVDPSLHAGGEIEFQKGDIILVDQLSADGYQRGDEPVPPFPSIEPVTEVTRVFVRQLNDFPFLLKTLTRQNELYTKELARVKANNDRSSQAVADTEAQARIRDDAVEKLLADQEKFERDLDVVKAYLGKARIQKDDIETVVSELERKIRDNHRKSRGYSRLMESVDSSREVETGALEGAENGNPVSDPGTTAPEAPATDFSPVGDFAPN